MNSERKNDPVRGSVDDFRHYTSQRTLEEIKSDYHKTITGNEPALSHYYRFENDLVDSTGNDDLRTSGSFSFSKDVYRDNNGWRGEQIDVSVSDIRPLFALNGTFDTGIPGTNEDWSGDGFYHPEGWLAQREVLSYYGRQRTSYVEDVDDYIILENEGYFRDDPDRYVHYNGTRIFWYQDIDNTDLNEEFYFSLNYLYESGPIGSHFENNFTLRFEILDGDTSLWNWSRDLVNTTQRQTWYTTGSKLVNITNPPTSFEARLTLEVSTPDDSIEIYDNDSDLDGDSTNGQLITVHIDDISLTGPPLSNPADVNLKVNAPHVGNASVTGSQGLGSARLNHTYWEDYAVPLQFSADANVSFECSAKVSKMSRLFNSSRTTSLQEEGVTFSCSSETNINLTMFTYIQSYPETDRVGFTVHHTNACENVTLLFPFGTEVTASIISEPGLDEVPIGLIDSVGWWLIELSGPNYAQAFSTQGYNETSSWEAREVFYDGDSIRCNLILGTNTESPSSSGYLEVKWSKSQGIAGEFTTCVVIHCFF
jgi:hypothetical protein